jgi:AcrR family transcriptional regulator
MSDRRAATAQRVRGALLDAAETLLSERQPGSITSRDIARAAGVSDGVLYNHFADKHDLLLRALVRRFGGLMEAFLADRVEPGSAAVGDELAEVIRRLHGLHLQALPMLANLAGDPELLRRFLIEIHRPPLGGDAFRLPVAGFLAAEQAAGRLGAFDPDAAADVIVGAVLMQGLIDTLGHRPQADAAARLAAIATTVLHGLSPADPAPNPDPDPAATTRHPIRSTR